jgi:hypothetical protein
LLATTKDRKNGLQFDVGDSAVVFRAATFEDPGITK